MLFVGHEFRNGLRWTLVCTTSTEQGMQEFCERNGIDYGDAVRRHCEKTF